MGLIRSNLLGSNPHIAFVGPWYSQCCVFFAKNGVLVEGAAHTMCTAQILLAFPDVVPETGPPTKCACPLLMPALDLTTSLVISGHSLTFVVQLTLTMQTFPGHDPSSSPSAHGILVSKTVSNGLVSFYIPLNEG